jgi:hypothetical protein
MAAAVAYVGSSNTIELSGFTRYGETVNDARITLVVRDAAGVDIAGPMMVRYVEGTDGIYRGGFSSEVPLVAGGKYFAIVDADVSGDHGHWEMPFTARTRTK